MIAEILLQQYKKEYHAQAEVGGELPQIFSQPQMNIIKNSFEILNSLEIITHPISANHTNAFWYYGQKIASIKLKDGRKIHLESVGQITMRLEQEGKWYHNEEMLLLANLAKMTDLDIEAIHNNCWVWHSNWFGVNSNDVDFVDIGEEWIYDEMKENYNTGIAFLIDVKQTLDKLL